MPGRAAERPAGPRTGARAALAEAMLAYKDGDYLRAVRIYRHVLDAEPRNHEALHHFGMALYQLDRREEAIQLIEASLHVEPDQSDAWLNLARIHFNDARYDAALEAVARARALAGDAADVMELLGRCQLAGGRQAEAVDSFAAALAASPDDMTLALRLADACETAKRDADAISWYRYVLEREPGRKRARVACALLLRRAGKAEEALACLRAGRERDPDDVELRHNEAAQLDEAGRFEEARSGYLAVLDAEPKHALALGSLLRMKGGGADAAQVERAAAIARDPEAPQFDRVFLHYSLGRYYDTEGRHDDAFGHYRDANALQAGTFGYSGDALERWVDAATRRLTSAWLRERTPDEPGAVARPIFVVGLPRSGTTLTEQILASHSAVFGAGEVDYFVGAFGRGLDGRGDAGHPRQVCRMRAADLDRVRREYLERLRVLDDTHTRVVDKMPFNFLHLGLVRAAFPSARIVHCVRDPLDTLLSCYFENLSGDFSFSMSFERLAHFYAQYRRLMAHWSEALGGEMLELRYEDLVSDLEATSRRLVAFCDLPWEDRCLRFFATERAISTPSNWQVRQPIYGSSVGRWKHYAQHLAPLQKALAEAQDMPALSLDLSDFRLT